jgi:hypothetical protein
LIYINQAQRPQVISIETSNSGLDDSYEMNLDIKAAKYCRDVFERVLREDNIIVDVGSSNTEEFMRQLKQFDGAYAYFDHYIIPTIPGKKQGQDTCATINELIELGVPQSSLRLVLNKVNEFTESSVLSEFQELITQLKVFGYCITVALPDETRGAIEVMLGNGKKSKSIQAVAIPESDVFDRARSIIDQEGRTRSVAELSVDETNYRAELRQAQSDEQRDKIINIQLACALARTQEKYHQFAWSSLRLEEIL